jgi:hypothetical protein
MPETASVVIVGYVMMASRRMTAKEELPPYVDIPNIFPRSLTSTVIFPAAKTP